MKSIIPIITLASFLACNNSTEKSSIRVNEKDSADKISYHSSDENKMNAAVGEARRTFPVLLNVLKVNCADCERVSVKIRLGFGDNNGEHVWLDSLFLENDKLYGLLANIPEQVTRVKYGDLLEAKPDSVSDWMYIQNGKLVGGYTIKVDYDGLSESEKKQMEIEFGAKIR